MVLVIHKHYNICAFTTFNSLLIINLDTLVMAVIRYVIGGATWLVRDKESDRET